MKKAPVHFPALFRSALRLEIESQDAQILVNLVQLHLEAEIPRQMQNLMIGTAFHDSVDTAILFPIHS